MAKNFSKAQLAAALAERNGLTKRAGARILTSLAELAHEKTQTSFTLPGIGKFVVYSRKPRMGRNPKTLQPVPITARKIVKFRVAKAFSEAVAKGEKS